LMKWEEDVRVSIDIGGFSWNNQTGCCLSK
jgi:hypothetical protein